MVVIRCVTVTSNYCSYTDMGNTGVNLRSSYKWLFDFCSAYVTFL